MVDTPGGPDDGITTTPQVEASAPATPENAETQSDVGGADKHAKFRDAGGNFDTERILNSYDELQAKLDSQGGEVGDLRMRDARYEAFFRSEYVGDPDNPGKAVHKSSLEQSQQPAQPSADGQLSQAEIAEKLRDLQDDDPIAYHNMMLDAATNAAVDRMGQREAVYADPGAQKILGDYPDVRGRAEAISREQSVPLDTAFKLAVGEAVMGVASGDSPAAPSLPTNINLGNLTTPSRTFMHPRGTTPTAEPESRLTDAQKTRIREQYGPDVDLREWEPYSDDAHKERQNA